MITARECAEQMAALSDSDREGANQVAASRINGYWAEHGHVVNARVETRSVWNGTRNWPLSVIVSDTLNGLPK